MNSFAKKIFFGMLCSTFLMCASKAFASGGYVSAKVSIIQIGELPGFTESGIYGLVEMDKVKSGGPACATDPRWAFDPTTDLGQQLYSALLSAKHAGSKVELFGTGNCDLMGKEFESILYLRIY